MRLSVFRVLGFAVLLGGCGTSVDPPESQTPATSSAPSSESESPSQNGSPENGSPENGATKIENGDTSETPALHGGLPTAEQAASTLAPLACSSGEECHYRLTTRERIMPGAEPLSALPGYVLTHTNGDGTRVVTTRPAAVASQPLDRIERFVGADGVLVEARVLAPRIVSSAGCTAGTVFDIAPNASEAIGDMDVTAGVCKLTVREKRVRQDAYDYVSHALAAAKRKHATHVVFPQATLDFSSTHGDSGYVELKGLTDVLVDFSGSVYRLPEAAVGITFVNTTRVAVQNLRLVYTMRIATLATVTKAPGASEDFVLKIADGYPDIPRPGGVVRAHFINHWDTARDTWAIKHAYSQAGAARHAPVQVWSAPNDSIPLPLRAAGPREYRSVHTTDTIDPLSRFVSGSSADVVVRFYGVETFAMFVSAACVDSTIKGVEVRGVPGMALAVAPGRRGVYVSNFTYLDQGENQLISGTRDGINIAAGADIIVEDSNVGHQGDDSLNIHGFISPLGAVGPEVSGGVEVRVDPPNGGGAQWRPGDVAALYDADLNYAGEARVASCANLNESTGGCVAVTADHDVTVRMRLHQIARLHPGATLARGWRVANVNLSPKRFVVRNNRFHDNNGRGMLIQGTSGLLDTNTISGNTAAGIFLTADVSVSGGGTFPANLTLRNNSVDGTGWHHNVLKPNGSSLGGGITVAAFLPPGANQIDHLIQFIAIDGNDKFVRNVGGPALVVVGANRVTIKNVRFDSVNEADTRRRGTGTERGVHVDGAVTLSRDIGVRMDRVSSAGEQITKTTVVDNDVSRLALWMAHGSRVRFRGLSTAENPAAAHLRLNFEPRENDDARSWTLVGNASGNAAGSCSEAGSSRPWAGTIDADLGTESFTNFTERLAVGPNASACDFEVTARAAEDANSANGFFLTKAVLH